MKKKRYPTSDARSASSIIDRLQVGLGCKTDAELARRLRRPPSHVSKWRANDSRPHDLCVLVAEEEGLSLDWLLAGHGPQWRAKEEEASERPGQRRFDLAEAEAQMGVFRAWLDGYWQGADLKVRWWVLEQLRRCLDEYDQHLQDGLRTAAKATDSDPG